MNIVTDVTSPIGVKGIETLFNAIDHPLILPLILVSPLILILFFAYRYEERKKERLLLVEKLGIEKNNDVLLWIITGKNEPDYINQKED